MRQQKKLPYRVSIKHLTLQTCISGEEQKKESKQFDLRIPVETRVVEIVNLI